jgi:hypothetical protein
MFNFFKRPKKIPHFPRLQASARKDSYFRRMASWDAISRIKKWNVSLVFNAILHKFKDDPTERNTGATERVRSPIHFSHAG